MSYLPPRDLSAADWRASRVPLIRDRLVNEIGTQAAFAQRRPDVVDPHTARTAQLTAEALPHARMYWISDDLARAAMDASIDIPAVDLAPLLPTPAGLVVFAEPLPALPRIERLDDGLVSLDPTDTARPELLHWHVTDTDVVIQLHRRRDNPQKFASLTAMGIVRLNRETTLHPDEHLEGFECVGAFLAALLIFLDMPSVSTIEARPTKKTKSKGDRRARAVTESLVHVVDLRTLQHTPEPAGGTGTGSKHTHRYIVRGHWRQQAHGPQRSQRRPTWIASHVRGPADAPFSPRDIVYRWR